MKRVLILSAVVLAMTVAAASAQNTMRRSSSSYQTEPRMELIPMVGYAWTLGMDVYANGFPGELDFSDEMYYGGALDVTVSPPGSVKVVDFTLLGQRFQAITAGPHHDFNDAISIVVLCDDQAELDRYWNALLEGGGKPQACGWLIDRFGLRWQIVPAMLDALMRDAEPARAKRVTDALLKMVKLDIAALEKA